MSKNLFVGSLPFSVNSLELEDMFKQHGEVISAKVIVDRDSDRSRGFGFVEMGTPEAANAAIEALNGTEINGRTINVSIAKEKSSDGGGRDFKKKNYNNRY